MNDFAKTSPAPHFDATGIKSRTRRRRAGFIAAVSAAVIVAGGGTALATVSIGSNDARPAAAHTTTTDRNPVKGDTTTVPYVKPFSLKGMDLASAKAQLAQAGLKVGTVTHGVIDNCKPGSVIDVSPRLPAILHAGDKVDLGICG